MMIVIVVGVRGNGDLVIRRGGGQVDRRRRRSLLLLDAQVAGGGSGNIGGAAMLLMMMVMMMMMMVVMVVRRDAYGGGSRFRAAGAVLDGGAHRAYDRGRASATTFNRDDSGCSRERSRVASRAIRDQGVRNRSRPGTPKRANDEASESLHVLYAIYAIQLSRV